MPSHIFDNCPKRQFESIENLYSVDTGADSHGTELLTASNGSSAVCTAITPSCPARDPVYRYGCLHTSDTPHLTRVFSRQ